MENLPFLSILIALPLIGALAILLLARGDEETVARNAKQVALANSTIVFVISLLLWVGFDRADPGFQYVEEYTWIAQYNIAYRVGVDGISVLFVLLSTLLTPLCILSAWDAVKTRVKEYMVAFLVLEALMIGTFVALDLVLFYVFFEAVLIPMFLIIGVWGGARRVYSAFKFFLYTLLGSVLMLVAIMTLIFTQGTADMIQLVKGDLGLAQNIQIWLWLAFFASFAVKMPMWPVHTWLPDAHVEAPTAGSVILAGVLLKMGGYGFLRFSLPMLPEASEAMALFVQILSIIAIIYTSIVALAQEDMKKLIAYSSVAHMGYVTLGIFSLNDLGINGAIFQMLSHGVISAALFLIVGVVYDRLHTRMISRYGGVVETMPRYAIIFMLFMMASVGLPGTAGFVGEFMTLFGAFQSNMWVGIFAASGIVLGATYMLLLYRRVVFGKLEKDDLKSLLDMTPREIFIFAPLVILVLWMGIWPMPFLDVMSASVDALLVPFVEADAAGVATSN
ncbi:MAG: NADH-quinone oxidoreductase subunit M [Alphaproteobacteria bacterium]